MIDPSALLSTWFFSVVHFDKNYSCEAFTRIRNEFIKRKRFYHNRIDRNVKTELEG